jgi:hypothetical protein
VTDPVAWSVEIVRNPTAPWWLKSSTSLSGLTWEDTTASGWDSSWSADSAEGTPPTGDVAELTDVVGDRTVKVTAGTIIGGVTYEVSEELTFGKGPLSVFTSAPQADLQWATKDGTSETEDFTDSGNSFPAASHCGGSVVNNSNVVQISGSSSPYGLIMTTGGGWETGDDVWFSYDEYFSTSSKLPSMGQLIAVSRHFGGYNSGVHRKGAALAAGWPDDAVSGGLYRYWTGQVLFPSTGFFGADVVDLAYGSEGWGGFLTNTDPVTVCAEVDDPHVLSGGGARRTDGEITAVFDNADFNFPVVWSGAEWEVTGNQHLKSTATLTAVFKDGAGQVLTPGKVTWSVEIAQNPTAPWWLKSSASLSGLIWKDTTVSGWDSRWSADSAEGTPPAGDVAELTDVVGDRTVKVTAGTIIGGVTYEVSEEITFGKGPLSVFTSAPQVGLQWATKAEASGTDAFTDSGNSFPAAIHCGGTVNNDSSVVVVTPIPPANTTYSLSVSGAGWRAGGPWSGLYYSTSSGLPTSEQLLAVSRYSRGDNSNVPRKGAALAAGWPDDAEGRMNYGYWTGQVDFLAAGPFSADVVDLAYGIDYVVPYLAHTYPVTVCVAH